VPGRFVRYERLTFRMLVAECALSHVSKLNGSFGAGVHKPIAACRVELGSSDDLSELFHVRWFDIDNVEALVLNVEIPEVNPEVVGADKRLAIAIDGDAIDMIGVGICVGFAGNGCDNGIVMGKAR
jgi:hypothetical protein